jgi:hypothetical protein
MHDDPLVVPANGSLCEGKYLFFRRAPTVDEGVVKLNEGYVQVKDDFVLIVARVGDYRRST